MCCWRLAGNTGRKMMQKSLSAHHRTTLSGYIFATKACIDNRKKRLVKQQYLPHMSLQYAELRPTSGWDRFVSLGDPSKFQRVSRLGSVTARHLVVGVSQTVALNRGLHLYSAGRPSRWALAHISSYYYWKTSMLNKLCCSFRFVVCLSSLLIFPCTIESRSSLLAPAHLGVVPERAVKWLWCGMVVIKSDSDAYRYWWHCCWYLLAEAWKRQWWVEASHPCCLNLWSPYVIGQTIYIFILFLSSSSSFFFFFLA